MSLQSFAEFQSERKKTLLEGSKESRTSSPDQEVWKKWRSLINMSAGEIQKFMESEDGKDAGMKQSEADKAGIDSGKESARMLIKMIPIGGSYEAAEKNWTGSMWFWARKQNSFNSRMKGARKRIKGNPFEKDGQMTRWLKSMLTWGHDPRKPLRKV